jgi:hypothetical protein
MKKKRSLVLMHMLDVTHQTHWQGIIRQGKMNDYLVK